VNARVYSTKNQVRHHADFGISQYSFILKVLFYWGYTGISVTIDLLKKAVLTPI
jgi:hypothetical protein